MEKPSGIILNPRMVPNPDNSRIRAIQRSTYIYPAPDIIPSQSEISGGLDWAKASARPIIIQFVIISPTYGPSDREISGRKARRKISTRIT